MILHITPEAIVTKEFLKEHLIIMNLSDEQLDDQINNN